MSIKTLGKYQWEWLNKYGRINLIGAFIYYYMELVKIGVSSLY